MTTPAWADFNVRDYGARGDGKTIDSPAINKAIEEAAAAGGGTVIVPAGDYLCGSIRLKSNITLEIDKGATIIAAPGAPGLYDAAEDNPEAGKYEDFGHKHWHDSLIWGDHIQNVTIKGEGKIWGKGLSRSTYKKGTTPGGNKAIALKLCQHVNIEGITLQHGGWFGILATGTDDLHIDGIKEDTDRDGMDIDCCHDVTVTHCWVNSPFDDGICLKSSYGLGENRACENITITDDTVSGFDEGTLIDGTKQRKVTHYDDKTPTGRIKFGTESNGGLKHVTISDCTFIYCRGLAIETVDGGIVEDVTATHLTMHDVQNSPIFLRLGSRLRGPEDSTSIGVMKNVTISDVTCDNADSRFGCIIAGVQGHDIENVKLSDIKIQCRGGGTPEQANIVPPDHERDFYPEPYRWKVMPESGMYLRYVKGIELDNVSITYAKPDYRPTFDLQNVSNATFDKVTADRPKGVPAFVFKQVDGITTQNCAGVPDMQDHSADLGKL